MMRGLTVAVLLSCCGAVAAAAPAGSYVEAIVVGHNRSLDPALAPLHYADDDAARMHELLSMYADRTTLLAVLDAETQAAHPALAASARLPTRAAVLAQVRAAGRRLAAARRLGRETTAYFYFAGHGGVQAGGEGALHLLDGYLTRANLYAEVLPHLKADAVHVLIDACAAYHFVARRGGWKDDRVADRGALVRSYLRGLDLDRFPSVGVFVSTSGAEDAHEWSQIRGGVFSHVLRAALAGGADVNADGRVEYSEASAFAAAAYARVPDARARVRFFARGPARDLRRPLVDLRRARGATRIAIDARTRGRWILEDDRGIRVAELNKAAGRPLTLVVPVHRRLYAQHGGREAEIQVGRRSSDAALEWRDVRLTKRGSVAAAYQSGLFAEPFGWTFYRGYVALSGDLPVPATPSLALSDSGPLRSRFRIWKWATLGGAVAAGAGAAVAGLLVSRSRDAFEAGVSRNGVPDARLASELSGRRTATNVLIGVAGAAAATSLVLWLVDSRARRAAAPLVATPVAGGALLGLAGQF
jgi:hypothetical protein